MKKIIVGTLIVSAALAALTPPVVLATNKPITTSVIKPIPIFTSLLNAKVVDEHLYSVFSGEILVEDSGLDKQVSIVVGDQFVDAKYKSSQEDGKEIWSFSFNFNRKSLLKNNTLTFAIRLKTDGRVYWDTNQKYTLTEKNNIIFGATPVKVEDISYDWTYNLVKGTVVVKKIKNAKIAVTFTTDNWATRKTVFVKTIPQELVGGLQRYNFILPTNATNNNVQFFVSLITPQKKYVDNNTGLGYNIYR